MASSPFAGTELEDPWQHGFIAGWLAPDDVHQATSPLTPDHEDAYSKGVIAGQDANRGVRLASQANPEEKTYARYIKRI